MGQGSYEQTAPAPLNQHQKSPSAYVYNQNQPPSVSYSLPQKSLSITHAQNQLPSVPYNTAHQSPPATLVQPGTSKEQIYQLTVSYDQPQWSSLTVNNQPTSPVLNYQQQPPVPNYQQQQLPVTYNQPQEASIPNYQPQRTPVSYNNQRDSSATFNNQQHSSVLYSHPQSPSVSFNQEYQPSVHFNNQESSVSFNSQQQPSVSYKQKQVPTETYNQQYQQPSPYRFSYTAGRAPGQVDRSHSESGDAGGVVRGEFSYVDPRNQVRTVQYVADQNGFHPVLNKQAVPVTDTPAVAAAKQRHIQLKQRITEEHVRLRAALPPQQQNSHN